MTRTVTMEDEGGIRNGGGGFGGVRYEDEAILTWVASVGSYVALIGC
jgi:hypothetical protein